MKFKLIAVVLFCISFLQAQEKDNLHSHLKGVDILLKQKVDSLRTAYGLNELAIDKYCQTAAEIHSRYMSNEEVMSHFEMEVDSLFDPSERLRSAGAKNYVAGENVALIHVLPDSRKEDIASKVFKQWSESKGHYGNMMSQKYNVSGLACQFNDSSKVLYVTQVFAISPDGMESPNQNSGEEQSRFDVFKYKVKRSVSSANEEYEWKLSLPDDPSITRVNKKWLDENVELRIQDSALYLCVKNLRSFKNLFKDKKDGLAFEIINFESTYSCDSSKFYDRPTRENGRGLFNGRVLEPVYTKELLARIDTLIKETKGRRDLSCAGLFIDSLPDYWVEGNQSISMLYIRDRKIAKFIDFQAYCGSLMLPEVPEIEVPISFPSADFSSKVKKKAVDFRVYFKRNSIDFHTDKLDSILTILDDANVYVKEMRVNAFASIEGTSEINEKLYKKRGEVLLNSFQERQSQDIKLVVKTQENFEMFFDQIDSTEFSYLKDWSNDSIRQFVNQEVESFDSLLDAQRYGEILLILGVEEKFESVYDQALTEFTRKFERINKVSSGQKRRYVKRLIDLHGFLINSTLSDSIAYLDYLYKIPVTKIAVIDYHQLLFDYKYGLIDGSTLYKSLNTFKKLMPENTLVQNQMDAVYFNMYHWSLKRGVIKTDLVDRIIENTDSLSEEDKKALNLYKHFLISNNHFYRNSGVNKYKGNKSLKVIKEHYDSLDVELSVKKKLAYYFLAFNQAEWAVDYLKVFEREGTFDKEAYVTMIKALTVRSYLEGTKDYQAILMDAVNRLDAEDFCGLFFGPCNLDFQIFQDEVIQTLYCEVCNSNEEN